MSGLGFGDNMTNFANFTDNMTNFTDEFDCRISEQSSVNITNRTAWEVTAGKEVGTIIIGVILLLLFLVGTIWNLFIIITFFIKYQLLKEPANIFLLNIALMDLGLCLTIMMFSFVTAFNQEFVFGTNDVQRCAMCNVSSFFFIFLVLVSLHVLAALSIDRFILLSRPLRYKRFMNRWRAIAICIFVYILCFIIAMLPLPGIEFGQYEFNVRLSACMPRFTPSRNFIYAVFLALEALIPIIAVAITNVWTYRLVSKFLKKNFRRKSTYRRKDTEAASSEPSEGQKHQKQQKQLVKVFGALLIGTIIAYTPTITITMIFLILLLNDMPDLIPPEVYIVGFLSFLTSAVIHPIVESFFVKELRYQVNRARKGVRRASTAIYRQTTQLFRPETLDEAEKKVNEDTTPQSRRKNIRFLNGRIATVGEHSVSAVTEMEDMGNDASSNSRSPVRTPEPPDVQVANGDSDATTTTTTTTKRDRPMLEKTRKSVSFQENPRNRVTSNSSAGTPVNTDSPTSCLKHLPEVEEEPGQVDVSRQVDVSSEERSEDERTPDGQ